MPSQGGKKQQQEEEGEKDGFVNGKGEGGMPFSFRDAGARMGGMVGQVHAAAASGVAMPGAASTLQDMMMAATLLAKPPAERAAELVVMAKRPPSSQRQRASAPPAQQQQQQQHRRQQVQPSAQQPYLGKSLQEAKLAVPSSALEKWRLSQQRPPSSCGTCAAAASDIATAEKDVTPPAVTDSVAAKHPELACPQLWRKWVASLRQRGFFNGTAEGTKEYRARMAKARAKFAQSNVVSEKMTQMRHV